MRGSNLSVSDRLSGFRIPNVWQLLQSVFTSGTRSRKSLPSRIPIVALVVSEQDRRVLTSLSGQEALEVHFVESCEEARRVSERWRSAGYPVRPRLARNRVEGGRERSRGLTPWSLRHPDVRRCRRLPEAGTHPPGRLRCSSETPSSGYRITRDQTGSVLLDQWGIARSREARLTGAEIVGNEPCGCMIGSGNVVRCARRPGDRLKILLVSSSLSDSILLERLGKQQDWELRLTSSPRQAFRLVAESYFELILCDCNQPGYPWREVMDRLSVCSPEYILLISPVRDDYLRRDVLLQGGHDVLVRPLREESALHSLQAVLRFASSGSSVSVDC